MIITPTKLPGACLIDLERRYDERGFFARAWCWREFETNGLSNKVRQVNLSYTEKRGTLRGMHYQAVPWGETKLVRCTRGAVYDVIIDLRADSPTFLEWVGVELTADNRTALHVPEGFAHGFIALEDRTELMYQVSQYYHAQAEAGVRYDDPAIGIEWPIQIRQVSAKDRSWPDYVPATETAERV